MRLTPIKLRTHGSTQANQRVTTKSQAHDGNYHTEKETPFQQRLGNYNWVKLMEGVIFQFDTGRI